MSRSGPERWIWALAGAGWVVLAALLWGHALGLEPAVHGHHAGMEMDPGPVSAWRSDVGGHAVAWTAMVLASMLPLVSRNFRLLGLRSPRERRTRATVDAAAGWFTVWLGAGVVITGVALAAARSVPAAAVVGATACVAVLWQFTGVKRVAVARCHRTFAPPLGDGAGRACVRFGSTLGRDCAVSCWASMALMTVAGHRLSVVLPLAWLSWRERRLPPERPGTTVSVVVLVLVGLAAVLFPASSV